MNFILSIVQLNKLKVRLLKSNKFTTSKLYFDRKITLLSGILLKQGFKLSSFILEMLLSKFEKKVKPFVYIFYINFHSPLLYY